MTQDKGKELSAQKATKGIKNAEPPASTNLTQSQPQQIIVTHNPGAHHLMAKNIGVAFMLAFFFGPLGMLYSTIVGGIIMLIVSVIVALITLGFGLVATWPICIVWAVIAVNIHNKKLVGKMVTPVTQSTGQMTLYQKAF